MESREPLDVDQSNVATEKAQPERKRSSQFLTVLNTFVKKLAIDLNSSVLIVGGSYTDVDSLFALGLTNIVLSNIDGVDSNSDGTVEMIQCDLEDNSLEDQIFDIVFIHAVLHHCRSPHKALCNAIRIAKKYVIVMEPNDSQLMRILIKIRLSFPYETSAVVDHNFVSGGVRNSGIPNYIYRWNTHEIFKTASSFLAEYDFTLHAFPYWDFSVDAHELSLRKQTRISCITDIVGTDNFLRLLKTIQFSMNTVSPFRKQGNRYFCIIEKTSVLKPWLTQEGTEITFKRVFDQ